MIFENVSCTESDFNGMIRKYPNMSSLYLLGVTGLERIGEGFINMTGTLELKNLKILTITNCPNL
jgi:hypothetical protein